ncbi:hypothetical protein CCHR01_05517 [Colletotrichum chrysophilum]|uniref:Uncharacterized protein n=1 Tax=Colletotrichum chrysophilum TaxID=1836956 RepID=A0AAD9ELG0_9PEZI|nr:hypothetical protein CCHR01_05517 [Colletotrichum chrysophilum]
MRRAETRPAANTSAGFSPSFFSSCFWGSYERERLLIYANRWDLFVSVLVRIEADRSPQIAVPRPRTSCRAISGNETAPGERRSEVLPNRTSPRAKTLPAVLARRSDKPGRTKRTSFQSSPVHAGSCPIFDAITLLLAVPPTCRGEGPRPAVLCDVCERRLAFMTRHRLILTTPARTRANLVLVA